MKINLEHLFLMVSNYIDSQYTYHYSKEKDVITFAYACSADNWFSELCATLNMDGKRLISFHRLILRWENKHEVIFPMEKHYNKIISYLANN